jgi:maltose alpha-D-glucosyltransferase / alpha-amylase
MQWSPDRNAGFSRADPQQLYLPPIMDPVYGYQAVNVEAQARDRSSLLNWMKRLLLVRRGSQAFGRGTLRFIRPGNRRVLVYLRQYQDDTILCVANLSRSAQPVELDLAAHKGAVPIELLGRTAFPPIGELPYLLTLPGYAFYWFRLSREAEAPPWHDERAAREDLPLLVLVDGWHSFFPERVAPWRQAAAVALRAQLEGRVVPGFIAGQRWAASALVAPPAGPAALGAGSGGAQLIDAVAPPELARWLVGIFEIRGGAQAGRYFVPLATAFEDTEEARWRRLQPAALARVRQHAAVGVLADAGADEDFSRALVEVIGGSRTLPTADGSVQCAPTSAFAALSPAALRELPVSAVAAQGGHTAVRIGDAFLLKICRRLHEGINPGVEIGRYLTEVAHFPNTAPLAGSIEYRRADGSSCTLALLHGYVGNQGDGWDYTVNHLVRFLGDLTRAPVPEDAHGLYFSLIRKLATRTAQLHAALAANGEPDFAPEPVTPQDLREWAQQSHQAIESAFELLGERTATLADAVTLLAQRSRLLRRGPVLDAELRGWKFRCHGDYHLRRVLLKRNDFVITDFEGSAEQSLAQRRAKRSPLRDLARMLRSFAYARWMALQQWSLNSRDQLGRWEPQLDAWERQTRELFVSTYDAVAQAQGEHAVRALDNPLLRQFELEAACSDLRRALLERPEWAALVLKSVLTLAG